MRTMRMLALVTLTLPAEVFEREMLPVVPQGTVTMVAGAERFELAGWRRRWMPTRSRG